MTLRRFDLDLTAGSRLGSFGVRLLHGLAPTSKICESPWRSAPSPRRSWS
ncbi:hypothetical protein [Micromonospora maritima]